MNGVLPLSHSERDLVGSRGRGGDRGGVGPPPPPVVFGSETEAGRAGGLVEDGVDGLEEDVAVDAKPMLWSTGCRRSTACRCFDGRLVHVRAGRRYRSPTVTVKSGSEALQSKT